MGESDENGKTGCRGNGPEPPAPRAPSVEELENLNRKLDTLISKMDAIETVLGMNSHPVLSSVLRGVKLETGLAEGALRGADYLTSLGVRDRIAQDVLKALMEKDGQNVTQVTESIRLRRGSASRRIVATKLASLERKGLVEQRPGAGRSKRFFIKR